MRVSINLQPTIKLERGHTSAYRASILAMFGLPTIIFVALLGLWWQEQQTIEKLQGTVTVLETKLSSQRLMVKETKALLQKNGLTRNALEGRTKALVSLFKERLPVGATVLQRLEDELPDDARATSLVLVRVGPTANLRLELSGVARSPEAIAQTIDNLQKRFSTTVHCRSLDRRDNSQEWNFAIDANLGTAQALVSTTTTTTTTRTTTEGSTQ